jgi:hypothetical protein
VHKLGLIAPYFHTAKAFANATPAFNLPAIVTLTLLVSRNNRISPYVIMKNARGSSYFLLTPFPVSSPLRQ